MKYADAQLAVTAEHGFSNWHSFGEIVRGQALALSGKADEAIAQIKCALDSIVAAGAAVPGWAYVNLAFSYLALCALNQSRLLFLARVFKKSIDSFCITVFMRSKIGIAFRY